MLQLWVPISNTAFNSYVFLVIFGLMSEWRYSYHIYIFIYVLLSLNPKAVKDKAFYHLKLIQS